MRKRQEGGLVGFGVLLMALVRFFIAKFAKDLDEPTLRRFELSLLAVITILAVSQFVLYFFLQVAIPMPA